MQLALVFPGQGSQKPGMGKPLAENFAVARLVFEEIDEALSERLSRTIFDGSEADLLRTDITQPALMAVSLAVLAVLKAEAGLDPRMARFVAGHSLGEYSALAAAGAYSVADTARLLRARGRAMQKAAPGDPGAMTAVLGIDDIAKVEEIAAAAARAERGVCVVANDNSPGQVVLSGTTAAIARAEILAKEAGAKRALRLPVAAAFHSPLMQPAADEMHKVLLAAAAAKAPKPSLIANVTAAAVTDAAQIAGLLVQQITGRVRWRETVAALAPGGADTQVEIGAGKVLTGLAKRIEPSLATFAVETPADVDAFVKAAQGKS